MGEQLLAAGAARPGAFKPGWRTKRPAAAIKAAAGMDGSTHSLEVGERPHRHS